MRLNWKVLRWAGIPALLLLGAGCGGLSATGGASPGTFLLPGVLRADPPAPRPEQSLPTDEFANEVARL